MHAQQEDVVVFAEPQQTGSKQWTSRQIERPFTFFRENAVQIPVKIVQGRRSVGCRRNHLHDRPNPGVGSGVPSKELLPKEKTRSENRVAGYDATEAFPES